MILKTQNFFQLLHLHHRLPRPSRGSDLTGRLTVIADGRIKSDPLTQRCLRLFLGKRIQT